MCLHLPVIFTVYCKSNSSDFEERNPRVRPSCTLVDACVYRMSGFAIITHSVFVARIDSLQKSHFINLKSSVKIFLNLIKLRIPV